MDFHGAIPRWCASFLKTADARECSGVFEKRGGEIPPKQKGAATGRPFRKVSNELGQAYIMSMPPMPPGGMPGMPPSSFLGASATPASVVTSRPATDAAS